MGFTYNTFPGRGGFSFERAFDCLYKTLELYSKLSTTYFKCEEQYREPLTEIMSLLLISYSKLDIIANDEDASELKGDEFKEKWQNAALQKWVQTCIEQLDNISTPGLKHKIDSKNMEAYRKFCIDLWIGVDKALMESGNKQHKYADILFKLIRVRAINREIKDLFEKWKEPTKDWRISKTLVAALANSQTLAKDQLDTLFELAVSFMSIDHLNKTRKHIFDLFMQDQNAGIFRSFVLFLSQSSHHQKILPALTLLDVENVAGITKIIEALSKESIDSTEFNENILTVIAANIAFIDAYIIEHDNNLAPSIRSHYLEQNIKLIAVASEIITRMQLIPESLSAIMDHLMEESKFEEAAMLLAIKPEIIDTINMQQITIERLDDKFLDLMDSDKNPSFVLNPRIYVNLLLCRIAGMHTTTAAARESRADLMGRIQNNSVSEIVEVLLQGVILRPPNVEDIKITFARLMVYMKGTYNMITLNQHLGTGAPFKKIANDSGIIATILYELSDNCVISKPKISKPL